MQNQKSPPELPNSWRTAATQRRLSVDTLLSLLLVGVLQGVRVFDITLCVMIMGISTISQSDLFPEAPNDRFLDGDRS